MTIYKFDPNPDKSGIDTGSPFALYGPMSGLIICATKPEWGALKKTFSFKKMAASPLSLYVEEQQNFYLLQTGIGPTRAKNALEQYLAQNKPDWIIHFGLSGGLDESLQTGDCLLASSIVSVHGVIPPSAAQLTPLVQRAQDQIIPLKTTAFFCSERVLETPAQKREAHQKFHAGAVDMESYSIAIIATEKNIPFCLLRSIFDPADHDLSLLAQAETIDDLGDLKATGLMKSLWRQPKLLMSLPRYQAQASRANNNLAALLTPFLKNPALIQNMLAH